MPSTQYLIEAPNHVTLDARTLFDAVAQEAVTHDSAVDGLRRSLPQSMAFTYDREPCDTLDVEQFAGYLSRNPRGNPKPPEAAWSKLQATIPNVFYGSGDNAVLDPTGLYDFLDTNYHNPRQSTLRPRQPLLGLAIAVADHFGAPSQAPKPAELDSYRLTSRPQAMSVPLVGGVAVENAWRTGNETPLSNEVSKGYISIAKLLMGGCAPGFAATYQRLRAGKLHARRGVFFQVVPGSEPAPIAVEPHYFAAGIDVAVANNLTGVLGSADFQLRRFRRALAAREDLIAAPVTPQS